MNYSHVLAALVVASGPFVSDAAMAAKIPYQEFIDVPCAGTSCTGHFKPVPPDRRLEITHMACDISAFSTGATGVQGATLRVTKAADGSVLLDEPLPLQRTANTIVNFVGSVQTRVFVQARQGIEILAGGQGGPLSRLRCKIAGDLFTVP